MKTSSTPAPPKPRGFAAMDPEKRREIAVRGGKNVPRDRRAYAQNRELASAAGKKGGAISRRSKKTEG